MATHAARHAGAAPVPTTSGATRPETTTPAAPPIQIIPAARPRSAGATRSRVRAMVSTVAGAEKRPISSRQAPS